MSLEASLPSIAHGQSVEITGEVLGVSQEAGQPAVSVPLAGHPVAVSEQRSGRWVILDVASTDENGRYTMLVAPSVGVHHLRATAPAAAGQATGGISEAVTVTVTRAETGLTVSAPATVTSETAFDVTVRLTSPTAPPQDLAGLAVSLQAAAGGTWRTVAGGVTGAGGTAVLRTSVWKASSLRASASRTRTMAAATSQPVSVATRPSAAVVTPPPGAPEPAVRFPTAPAPVGTGANAQITSLPDTVWNAMQNRTWHPGCPARSGLRHVQVNYWGFDGYRYRGQIVVASSVAGQTAAIFTDLFAQRYPIRLMVLPDRYGPNPLGPGANDYASMAADNTSGFNCRYVIGRERSKVWSPHMTGRAIDINTWENPFAAATGTFPNAWYLRNRPSSRPVLTPSGAATRAFTSRGWTWGGSWPSKDYQHFQR